MDYDEVGIYVWRENDPDLTFNRCPIKSNKEGCWSKYGDEDDQIKNYLKTKDTNNSYHSYTVQGLQPTTQYEIVIRGVISK